jgi:hypothetical protein
VVDPCVGQGVVLNLITHSADVRRYGVELDAERALAASSMGIETIRGNTFDAVAGPRCSGSAAARSITSRVLSRPKTCG